MVDGVRVKLLVSLVTSQHIFYENNATGSKFGLSANGGPFVRHKLERYGSEFVSYAGYLERSGLARRILFGQLLIAPDGSETIVAGVLYHQRNSRNPEKEEYAKRMQDECTVLLFYPSLNHIQPIGCSAIAGITSGWVSQ